MRIFLFLILILFTKVFLKMFSILCPRICTLFHTPQRVVQQSQLRLRKRLPKMNRSGNTITVKYISCGGGGGGANNNRNAFYASFSSGLPNITPAPHIHGQSPQVVWEGIVSLTTSLHTYLRCPLLSEISHNPTTYRTYDESRLLITHRIYRPQTILTLRTSYVWF